MARRCNICGISFTRLKNLREHLRRHGKGEKLECDRCGEKFNWTSSLRNHRNIAHGDKTFLQCEYISKAPF